MEDFNKYLEAGKIANNVLTYAKKIIKPGISLLDATDLLEKKILELGGKMAFPPQISCNEIAAHFYPSYDCDIIFEDQLCCVDVGIHLDGYIADTAITIDLSNQNKELVNASRDALNQALKLIVPGISVYEIGKVIEETILSYNFKPVKNLSGHGISRYNIHTSPSIPNFNNKDPTILQENDIIAIEPFASMGSGLVHESGSSNLFMKISDRNIRNPFARDLLKTINSFNNLPFAKRWLLKSNSLPKVNFGLNELLKNNIIVSFPPLVDTNLVSQAEHTVIIKDKPIITTKV